MQEVTGFWFVVGSVLFHSILYQASKHYLVEWICKRFFSKEVVLERDLKNETSSSTATSKLGAHSGDKKVVTDGDIATVAVEIVAICIGTFIGAMGLYIMYETRHDTLYSRSSVLHACCHIAAWYFVVDFYNMYDAYYLRHKISHLPMSRRLYSFFKARLPYILHHSILFLIGYIIIMCSDLRKHKGDFYVASIFIEDLTNPLLSGAKSLKLLGQEQSTLYVINGYVMVAAFFIFRILNFPFDMIVYSAQYHHWDIWRAIRHLTPICYISMAAMLSFQVYWFIAIVKLALRQLKANKTTPQTYKNKTD